MATAREILQAQLDAINADLAANPAVSDPRLIKKNELENDLANATPWYDYDVDVMKAFFAKYF